MLFTETLVFFSLFSLSLTLTLSLSLLLLKSFLFIASVALILDYCDPLCPGMFVYLYEWARHGSNGPFVMFVA